MMSARWMPRRRLPMKDAATPRKALGTCWQRVIQGYPNGATPPRQRGDTSAMGVGRPRELKHLSTARKREDSRSSGERNGRSPNRVSVRAGTRCWAGVERSVRSAVPRIRRDVCVEPNGTGTADRRG